MPYARQDLPQLGRMARSNDDQVLNSGRRRGHQGSVSRTRVAHHNLHLVDQLLLDLVQDLLLPHLGHASTLDRDSF